MIRSARRPAAAALLLASLAALAAGRPRYGGNLRVAVGASAIREDPALADAPEEAAISAVLSPPLCRVDAGGRVRPLLAELTRPSALRVRAALAPHRPGGVTPAAILERWERLSRPATLSPYRALLAPLKYEGRRFDRPGAGTELELALAYPWPDLERALCHPALGIPGGAGAFAPTKASGQYLANAGFPAGRPFADRLSVAAVSDRAAARLLQLHQADVLIGSSDEAPAAAGPALYATYLAFRPARVGPELKAQVEAAIDPADLARYFARAPAVPLYALLPPALMPQPAPPRSDMPALPAPREATLLYDGSRDDQRAVAERLQVKLHDRGYRIALRPLDRASLRAAWAKGDFDLLLQSVLLPPAPGPALAVVLDLAGRHDLLAAELSAVGAVVDPAARDALARDRAEALRATLPVVPLFAQALSIETSPHLAGLAFDALGLPALDWAFLVP